MLKADEFMKSDVANVQETYFGLCMEKCRENVKCEILPLEWHSNYVPLNKKQKRQLWICVDVVKRFYALWIVT